MFILGEGKGTQLADLVVNEITDAGGVAVPNYDSVENGESIVATAINHFGRIDILINNAGILRDRSFANLSESEWDIIFQVHVKGAFKCTKAAWPFMRKQKYGRIILTSSASGLYGNFGQTNYGAAKLALVGFANALVIEGRKSNIHVNTIAPISETRMTIDIMGDSGMMIPEHVAPVVLYMCHERCEDSGDIIETGGGFAAQVKWQKAEGIQMRKYLGDNITMEKVAETWEKITDFSVTCEAETITGSTMLVTESIQKLPEHCPEEKLVELLCSQKLEDGVIDYEADDIIKYALSVGAKIPDDIPFLFEGHLDFSALPSYVSVYAVTSMMHTMQSSISDVPGMERVDPSRVLHGEQYVELSQPLPTSGKLILRNRVVDLLDKKRFSSLICEMDILDEDENNIGMMQSVALFMGSGGIGRKGQCPKHIKPAAMPDREPDAVCQDVTSASQAALFRLNGDKNPIHIDPDMAAMMGFQVPILHGLCSFGFAMRHVLKTYANNDASLFKAMKVQFSKPVKPGDTLVTEMWRADSRILFQTRVKETGDLVIKGGFIDLKSVHVDKHQSSKL